MRVFSGIQPSGIIHIGNYFGAIKNWIKLQEKHECIFCIVNYHALTTPQDPETLLKNTYKTLAIFLACGIDPKKAVIFVQSQIPYHTELCWILNTIAKVGELERMTQYKEKIKERKESPNVGLFDYPVLMASDILLYQTDLVPVGEDQRQHLELTRTLARRFNRIFGKTFKIPKALIKKEGGKIMALDNPEKKMSKSASSSYNYISLEDPPSLIEEKIRKAVTDTEKVIRYSPKEKPGISNLLLIYSLASGKKIKELEEKYKGKGYFEFKKDLAKVLINFLTPIQEKKEKIEKDKKYLEEVLEKGQKKAEKIAKETIEKVKRKVGLI